MIASTRFARWRRLCLIGLSGGTPHEAESRPTLPPAPSWGLVVVTLLVCVGLRWLDPDRGTQVQGAAIFAAIWAAIEAIGAILSTVGGAIATTVEAAVVYLASAVGWLAARVASILLSTGTMFARVWEWVRRGYDLVLKPVLLWLHDVYERVTGWLSKFFRPVFDFLSHVRTVLMDVYARFLRPILTALDIAHAVLKTLADFHIAWAATLDRWVTNAESLITENFLKILGYLNEVRDVVNSVVTPDRLLQRLPFVRTIERDAGYVVRLWWNAQIAKPDEADLKRRRAQTIDATATSYLVAQSGAYYTNGSGDFADDINAIIDDWRVALSA